MVPILVFPKARNLLTLLEHEEMINVDSYRSKSIKM